MLNIPQPTGNMPEVYNNAEAAAILGVSPASLEIDRTARKRWRVPYLKIGRRVLYRRADLLAFLDRCRVEG
jgi:hypothetical protein